MENHRGQPWRKSRLSVMCDILCGLREVRVIKRGQNVNVKLEWGRVKGFSPPSLSRLSNILHDLGIFNWCRLIFYSPHAYHPHHFQFPSKYLYIFFFCFDNTKIISGIRSIRTETLTTWKTTTKSSRDS